MNLKVLVALFFISFFFTNLQAQNEEYEWIYEDLKVLDGTWFLPSDKGDFLEIWETQDDSTMIGRGVRIKLENSDTVNIAYMTMKKRGGEVYFSAKVRRQNNGEEVEYILTEADAETSTFTFENTEVDYPRQVKYVLLDRREIIVRKQGIRSTTGREKKEEFQYQREFAASKASFRLWGGANYSNLYKQGSLGVTGLNEPSWGGRPGWDIGLQYVLEGRGGFASIAFDFGISGRYNSVQTNFYASSADTFFIRDGQYNQTWGTLAILPHLHLIREGKLSVYAGPYFSGLFVNRLKGEVQPVEDPTYNTTDDLKKRNVGLIGGVVVACNPWKKDLGGQLGLRVNYGLGNVDNLYEKLFDSITASGTVKQIAFQVTYSIDILKF